MKPSLVLSTLFLLVAAGSLRAQSRATVESAPARSYLLELTQRWGADSPLGSALDRSLGPDDIDLRVWGGYGLGGTSAVILQRRSGTWSGWVAVVRECLDFVPIPVADTAGAATMEGFRQRARHECGQPRRDTLHAATVIRVDSVELHGLLGNEVLGAAWTDAVHAGLLSLPPQVRRSWTMLDGFTYVIELRRGDIYRASVIEHVAKPETDADRQVQAVYRAVTRFLGS